MGQRACGRSRRCRPLQPTTSTCIIRCIIASRGRGGRVEDAGAQPASATVGHAALDIDELLRAQATGPTFRRTPALRWGLEGSSAC